MAEGDRGGTGPGTFAEIAEGLRDLRAHGGQPSFTEIARRITRDRTARGLPPAEAQIARVTVYDCFRPDRKRLDTDLVLDLVRALGGDRSEVQRWAGALQAVHQRASAASVVTVTDQIPDDGSTFVGRAPELDTLTRAEVPAWVSGMPGAGKSRLAFRAAREWVASGRVDGALLVDLRGFSPEGPPADAEAVLDGLLRLLGVPARQQPGGVQARSAMLVDLLTQRPHVIILDDAADVGQVGTILPVPHGLPVIVTSRTKPETETAAYTHLALGLFTPQESLAALRLVVGDGRVDADVQAAQELVETTGHLPLAVNLTASRVQTRPEWSLTDHLELAATRARTLRLDQVVTETFALSYQALDDDAQAMLRLLAVHPVALLDHDSVLALAGGVVADPGHNLDLLTRHHLITRPRPGRYAIHELLRVHAADRSLEIDPPAWRAAARDRLVRSLVSRAWSAYRVRTAAVGEVPRGPREELGIHPMSLEEAEGFFAEATDVLLLLAHGEYPDGETSPAVAISETMTGWLDHVGRFHDAQTLHREALRLARQNGDEEGEARARVDLGMRLASVGRYSESQAELLAAEPLVRTRAREAVSVHNALGIVTERQGDVEGSVPYYRTAIDLAEGLSDLRRLGHAWSNLAGALLRIGQLTESQDALERSVDLARRAGDEPSVARGLVNLASLLLTREDLAGAEVAARDALERFEKLGQVPGVVVSCSNLGAALLRRGEHADALACLHRGAQEARAIGMRQHETTVLSNIARCHLELGDRIEGEHQARAALALALEVGDPYERSTALTVLGDCLAPAGADAPGDAAGAQEAWNEAVRLLDEIGSPDAEPVRERMQRLTVG